MMSFIGILLPAVIGLFLWMYLLTYFMYRWAGKDFFSRARVGFLRGSIVAGVFIVFDMVPSLSPLIGTDWIVFPLIFFIFSIPFSWRRIGASATLPIFGWILLFFCASFLVQKVVFWSPFHEEIGKWYQSITASYPAILSPFVSLGFSFVENVRYYSAEISWGQVLGRNLFSLPLHIFAGLLAFWCLFSCRSRVLGVFLGLVAAVTLHTLYNWSLDTSIVLTMLIMVGGYAFYWWSLENGWWKRSL